MYIDSYEVRGLSAIDEQRVGFLLELMQFQPKRYYTARQLWQGLRRAYGTRYFRKITYTLQPHAGDSARIVFDAERAPHSHLGLGLQYNSAVGIGLLTSLTSKDFLLPYSTTQVALNIGEKPRLRLQHVQYLTRNKTTYARLLAQGELVNVTTYNAAFDKTGLYTQRYAVVDAHVAKRLHSKEVVRLGTRFEHLRYRPQIASRLQLDGKIQQFNSYAFVEDNTLNATAYATQGSYFALKMIVVHGQQPGFQLLNDGQVVGDAPPPTSHLSLTPTPVSAWRPIIRSAKRQPCCCKYRLG